MHFMVVILSTPNSSIWTTKSSGCPTLILISVNEFVIVFEGVHFGITKVSCLSISRHFKSRRFLKIFLKDFNRDFIRFQILKNFTVQLSRLRFTTADEWDGKGDIVRDAAIFENFGGLKITHDQTIVLIPFVEFHPQNIIRCDKIFDENGPISMT